MDGGSGIGMYEVGEDAGTGIDVFTGMDPDLGIFRHQYFDTAAEIQITATLAMTQALAGMDVKPEKKRCQEIQVDYDDDFIAFIAPDPKSKPAPVIFAFGTACPLIYDLAFDRTANRIDIKQGHFNLYL